MQFIQANFWLLLALCVGVFVFGLVLMLMGHAIQRHGEKMMTRAQGVGYEEPLYPPVENYDPMYERHQG